MCVAGVLLSSASYGQSSRGNEFMIGFFPFNYDRPVAIFVTTNEPTPVRFTVEEYISIGWSPQIFSVLISTQNRTTEYGRTTVIRFLPISRIVAYELMTSAIRYVRVTAEGGKNITVFGLNDADDPGAFLALPCQSYDGITSSNPYEYFIFSANNPSFCSSFLIVTCEDDTTINILPSQTIRVFENITSAGGTLTLSGQQSRQTIYIEANQCGQDLTGTIITSEKPISVFAGHVCGRVSADRTTCGHLVEQIPPHVVWGTTFFTVPLGRRMAGDCFIVGVV